MKRQPRTEHGIQNAIRNALAGDCYLFRANVGQAWTGDAARLPNGDVLIRNPRPFSTGLPAGFSDLFGFRTIEITPAMVGQRLAVFVGVECKSQRGRVTDPQGRFLKAVTDAGGLAGVARTVDDALNIVRGADARG